MKFVYILIFSLLVIGCSSDIDKLWENHQEHIDYRAKLLKTQKAIFYDQNNTAKVIITATYLQENNNTEEFIISIYTDEKIEEDFFKIYTISLNNTPAQQIQPLSKDNKLLNNISFKTKWNRQFLVKFEHIDNDRLFIVFKDPNENEVKLYFAKKAKYLLSKSISF